MNPARPWFVLVAGINGAGKSTFAQDRVTIREFCGLTATSDEIEIINPDLVTKEILKDNPQLTLTKPTGGLPTVARIACGNWSKTRVVPL